MTYKLAIPLAKTALEKAGLAPILLEMAAFEQANGERPEELFYHYPLSLEQIAEFGRYRLIVKHRDGRICLSRTGRMLAGSL